MKIPPAEFFESLVLNGSNFRKPSEVSDSDWQNLITETKLDRYQAKAVLFDQEKQASSKIVLNASAGSGKTRVLTLRILKLLFDGYDINNVVAITFTRKATSEMKSRLLYYLYLFEKVFENWKPNWLVLDKYPICNYFLSKVEKNIWQSSLQIHTIDSFIISLLRKNPIPVNLLYNFEIADSLEKNERMKNVITKVMQEVENQNPSIFYCGLDLFNNLDEFYSSIIRLIDDKDISFKYFMRAYVNNCDVQQSLNNDYLMKKIVSFQKLIPSILDKVDKYETEILLEKLLLPVDTDNILPLWLEKKTRETFAIKKRKKINPVDDLVTCYMEILPSLELFWNNKRKEIENCFCQLWEINFRFWNEYKNYLGFSYLGDFERIDSLFKIDNKPFDFCHLLIDEFQDTDILQWEIVEQITREWFAGEGFYQSQGKHPSLLVVGDPMQSIFRFRGGDGRIISNLLGEGTDWKGYPLKINYRSGCNIIKSINESFPKLDIEAARTGGKVKKYLIEENKLEDIKKLLVNLLFSRHKSNKGEYDWKDIAILFRSNRYIDSFAKELDKNGIPAWSSSTRNLFDKDYVKLITAIINWLDQPDNSILLIYLLMLDDTISSDDAILLTKDFNGSGYPSLYSYLSESGNNKIRESKLWKMLKNSIEIRNSFSPWFTIKNILKELELQIIIENSGSKNDLFEYQMIISTVENLSFQTDNFVEFTAKWNETVSSRADFIIPSEENKEEKDYVTLSSIHKAKGLEWKLVILPYDFNTIRINPPKLPVYDDRTSKLFFDLGKLNNVLYEEFESFTEEFKEQTKEEEKRIFYVAATRAKDELVIFGTEKENFSWSTWLKNIETETPSELIEKQYYNPLRKEVDWDKIVERNPKSELLEINILDKEINYIQKTKGTVIHEFLRYLSGNEQCRQKPDFKKFMYHIENNFLLNEFDYSECWEEAVKIFNGKHGYLIKSKGETEFSVILDEKGNIGRIDKMIKYDDRVLILDYKSDKVKDRNYLKKHFMDNYAKTMNNYINAVKVIYKDYDIEAKWLSTFYEELITKD
ncbi:MAG: UvrD-helicase domain-containing protein [Candidatus Coatesbacteria bacterium]|nr:UvrD-helicase domain-containing protein [Candidatus Coatesbacteria bacterium]